MVLIAVDPHKSSHTAVAMDASGRIVAQGRFAAASPERLLEWAGRWKPRWWAVEGASGMGHPLSQWLVGRGETVRDVPAKLSARVRALNGLDSKNDVADAQSVAAVAHHRGEGLRTVRREDERAVLGLLARQRDQLNDQRNLVLGQLHELLRELGVAPARDLSARTAARACAECRPGTPADVERLGQARTLVEDLERCDARLRANEQECHRRVRALDSALTRVVGIASVGAVAIIGRVGTVARFASDAAFARHSGAAPLEASSGDTVRHRLNRGGDRRLNATLHIAAITQVRVKTSSGHAYYHRKRAEGKTHREALRCLKRRISDAVYRALLRDEARFSAAP